jgi:type IV pilus assembly protein PilM
MTSWNAITPFSSIAGGAGFDRREPSRPGIDDRLLPEPGGYPLGFVDVRAEAPTAGGADDERASWEESEAVVGSIELDDADETVEPDRPPKVEPEIDGPGAVAEEHVEEAREHDEHEVTLSEPTPVEPSKRRVRPRREKRGNGGGRGKVVGLKIGASQLAAAVVSQSNGSNELLELVRSPLAEGVVVDGEVRDAPALAAALRSFFSEHHLPTRDVRIGLASNRIGVRTFDIVGIEDEARFDNAVRFKAHEVLPVSVHDSVLDYRILGERFSESGEQMRHVFLVVAPKDQVEPYLEVAREAGLRLRGIDLEALALLRAFVEPRPVGLPVSDDRATVVVAIGHEASTLLVAGGGICEFTRVFDWGGSTLEEAIARELDIPAADAATILRHLSLTGPGLELSSLDPEARNRAMEAVRLRLTPFARELVSSLQFYQAQPDSLGIGEIVVTGGASHLEGLPEALNQMIGVAVRVGDPLGRVSVRGSLSADVEERLGSLAVPIGLAIEDFGTRGVDLTPRDARSSQRRLPSLKSVLLPAAVAVPAVAVGLFFFQASGKVSEREDALSVAQQELAALPEPKRAVIDPALQGEQAQRATAVAQVLGSRLAWDAVLRDVSRVLPADVWLTQLDAQVAAPAADASAVAAAAAAPAALAAPTGVNVTGYTFSQKDVAELLARLQTVPSLTNVQLQSSSRAEVGTKPVVQFTILADLREAGGAQ